VRHCLFAQSDSEWSFCPVIAKMPADMQWMDPLAERQRFELRQCANDKIIVTPW